MHPRIQRVASQTPYWLKATHVPGLTVALIEAGKTIDVLCYGTTKPDGLVPVTEETIFKAASLSKQALLYATLRSVETGKLDLDRSLSLYLDKPYPAEDPDLERITARHVLTHCTGWPNWPPDDEVIKRAWPLGEQWTYSGQAFLYLQDVLAAIWGETAEAYPAFGAGSTRNA